jgi:hypothetical protein
LRAVAQDIEVEDDVTAFLEYPNGATGVFITTVRARPPALKRPERFPQYIFSLWWFCTGAQGA